MATGKTICFFYERVPTFEENGLFTLGPVFYSANFRFLSKRF